MSQPADETRLGDLLVRSGKLSQDNLARAFETQRQRGGPQRSRLAEILLELGLVAVVDLQSARIETASMGAVPPASTLKQTGPQIRLGRFEIRAELGRGGMGAVYRAYDPQLQREVAVKIIQADGSLHSARSLDRFQREAEIVARLSHPGIVAIHEIMAHENQPVIVMDLVDGVSLTDLLLRDPPPSIQELVEIIIQVADALHYAHGQGVIHRDIKPANILIDRTGKPLLLDFGIARDVTASRALTATGEVVGTLSYLTPEQANARASEAGPHTDVYSLGATLYRAITGKAPFVAPSSVTLLKMILLDDPTPPRQLVEAIPLDVETITLKCLEKEPGQRYGSAEALAEELRRYLAGEAILARPQGPGERASRWLRRNPGMVAAVALVIAALVSAGIALQEPGKAGANRLAHTNDQPTPEASRRREPRPPAGVDQATDSATKRRAALIQHEARQGKFFKRLRGRDASSMRNRQRRPEADDELVSSVKVPADLVGEDLFHLAALPRLVQVDLSNTPFTDAGMAHLRPLTQLYNLDLQRTQVTDAGLVHLERLVSLQKLDLDFSQVHGPGLVHLRELTSLRELYLVGTQVTDEDLAHLVGLSSLAKLWLNATRVSDAGLVHLKELSSLRELLLGATGVTDEGLVHLKELWSLEELHLEATELRDEGLGYLKNLKRLKELRLDGTKVTDAGLLHLGGLRSLQKLHIRETSVTDAGLQHLQRLRRLTDLSLTGSLVTDEGVAALKEALPDCTVVR